VLTNLVVLAGPAASTFQKGQTVALIGWAPDGGAGSWAILGQWISPGTNAAAESVAFMNTALADQISAQVFAARIHNTTGASAVTDSTSWSDGGTGEFNAILTGVNVVTGFALMILDAEMWIDNVHATTPTGRMGARMSAEISGATAIDPDLLPGNRALVKTHRLGGSTSGQWESISSVSQTIPLPLNPGVHKFEARYQSIFAGNEVMVVRPAITVIAF
jgi:hypothetical protein